MKSFHLGDLRQHSKSFADFVSSARSQRDFAWDFAKDQLLEGALPEGVPSDLQGQLKDAGSLLIGYIEASVLASPLGNSVRTSAAGRYLAEQAKKVPSVEKVLSKLAKSDVYAPLFRLYLVASANSLELANSRLRVVDKRLTPYQAMTQANWSGTFAEYREGTVLTGPADPRSHFAIYLPSEKKKLRGSYLVTRITCEYR